MCWAAVGLIGSVISGVGAAREQQQAAANYRSQEAAQRRQAGINQTTGAYRAQRKQEEVQRTLGQNRAAYAASGLALSGSPLDVIEDNATEGALDVAAIRWNAGMEADTQRTNARVSGQNADNADSSVGMAFLTPVIGGIAKYGSSFGYGAKG
jgi:hypothetical protein